jgi:transposase InsO family protein
MTLATPSGRRFFLLLVDDATTYMWLTLLSAKGDAASAIKAAAEMEVGRPLHILRTDNSGEFTAKEFMEYYSNKGVQRHFSAPYTPQQNGIIERWNQSILGAARTTEGAWDASEILGRGDDNDSLSAKPCSDQAFE